MDSKTNVWVLMMFADGSMESHYFLKAELREVSVCEKVRLTGLSGAESQGDAPNRCPDCSKTLETAKQGGRAW